MTTIALVVTDDLQNVGTEKTGLACNNPDLDPTEPLWDQLGRDVSDQHDHVDEPEGWDPTAMCDQAGDRGLLWLCTVFPPAAEAPYCVLNKTLNDQYVLLITVESSSSPKQHQRIKSVQTESPKLLTSPTSLLSISQMHDPWDFLVGKGNENTFPWYQI